MEGNLVFSIIFPEYTVPLYTQLSGEEPELLLSTMIYILRDTMEVPEIWHSHMWCLLKQAEFCSVKVLAATLPGDLGLPWAELHLAIPVSLSYALTQPS